MKLKHSIFGLVIICVTAVSVSEAQNLNLKSINDWKIVVADTAIAFEKFAAQEFQNLFENSLSELTTKPYFFVF